MKNKIKFLLLFLNIILISLASIAKEVKKHRAQKGKEIVTPIVELTQEQKDDIQRFINDELVVFLMPDDDVVLGRVSENAKIDLMEYSDYLTLFSNSNYFFKTKEKRQKVNEFIEKHKKK